MDLEDTTQSQTSGLTIDEGSDSEISQNSNQPGVREPGVDIINITARKRCNEEESPMKPHKLSLTNVKSIIYNVIKDADVQKMLSNSLEEDPNKMEPATYEPKMTRAKMREYLQKEGNVPCPWPITPIKYCHNLREKFTDLTFPEDDDDEDYHPDKEVGNISNVYSDDDTESVISTQMSDVGSPACHLSQTPKVSGVPSLVLPNLSDDQKSLLCEVASVESERKFFDALDELDLSDTIACRTRSRLPLSHTSIDSIEAEFIPPDITLDMYADAEADEDPDWKDFLSRLFKNDIPTEDDDDPDADPEYNVLAEPEADDDHVLPVRVPKTEISLLLDEIYEAEVEEEEVQLASAVGMHKSASKSVKAADLLKQRRAAEQQKKGDKKFVSQPRLPTLTSSERDQLQRQMEIYVQLLCQQAVIAKRSAPDLCQQSVHFLRELETFGKGLLSSEKSSFHPVNLSCALSIVSDMQPAQAEGNNEGIEDVEKFSDTLTYLEMVTIASSPVFMYPELLPSKPFNSKPASSRIFFHHAEDVLICMGLHEFNNFSRKSYFISKYLLPVFTPTSIDTRINNETRTGKNSTKIKTTIGRYKKEGVIPGAIELLRLVKAEQFLAPIYKARQLIYPQWLRDGRLLPSGQLSFESAVKDKPKILPALSTALAPICNTYIIQDPNQKVTPIVLPAENFQISREHLGFSVHINKTLKDQQGECDTAVQEHFPQSVSEIDCNRSTPELGQVEGNQMDRQSADASVLSVLTDLSCAFYNNSSAKSPPPSDIVLMTPTKRALNYANTTPSSKQQIRIASSALPSVKRYEPLSVKWKQRNNSPRRKQLRIKAKSIMPKSFTPTVFILSPTKLAAKALTERALTRVIKQSRYLSSSMGKSTPIKHTSVRNSYAKSPSPQKTLVPEQKTENHPAVLKQMEDLDIMIQSSGSARQKGSKRHRYVACLAADILDTDPKKTEREDMFARWYINKVKERLGESSEQFTLFLQALSEFGKQRKSPSDFFNELRETIFKSEEELLLDFSAFLLPVQALLCGEKCYKACVQFHKARHFLRQMEVYFGANSKPFMRFLKVLHSDSEQSFTQRRVIISQLLRSHPILFEQFSSFFPDATPPKRHKDDYEEMDLTELDEEINTDGYEEMEIPEIDETNATLNCKCQCHFQVKGSHLFEERLMHCESCRIAVLHSRLFIHCGPKKGLRKAYIRYLNPLPGETSHETDEDDDSNSVIDEDIPHGCSEACSDLTCGKDTCQPEKFIANKISWTRDEDQMILEVLQQNTESLTLNEHDLLLLSQELINRSTDEIKERYDYLLNLLCQQLNDDSGNESYQDDR